MFLQEVSEAQQIALESSGELLAPESLFQRIEKDLAAIRAQYPAVAEVTHTHKWQPGKLIIQNVKKDALDKINTSAFGPSQSQAIFQDTIYLVTFQKAYNPEKLSELLQKELGIEGARPDGVVGGSSSITLTRDESGKYTYEFMKGWGDCFSGCINKHFWTFTVGPEENSVKLIEERGDDPNEQGADGDRPVGLFGGIH